MRMYFLHIYRGPMAGRIIPASPAMIAAAKRDGYGHALNDGRIPRADRTPHEKAEAFAAAYADRALRPALQIGRDPLADMRAGRTDQVQSDQVEGDAEGLARKRGRPPTKKV